jgi:hypothetical protein
VRREKAPGDVLPSLKRAEAMVLGAGAVSALSHTNRRNVVWNGFKPLPLTSFKGARDGYR